MGDEFRKKITDELGNRVQLPGPLSVSFVPPGYSQPSPMSLPIPFYPRRGKDLSIRLEPVIALRSGEALEFHVNNPIAAKCYPEWAAEWLPRTRTVDGLQVKLTSLRTGLPAKQSTISKRALFNGWDASVWTRADFQMRYDGKPSSAWTPKRVHIRDATGNDWTSDIVADTGAPGTCSAWIPENLWNEPSWKLQFSFVQVKGSPIGQRCTLQIKLPARGMVQQAIPEVTVSDVKLKAGLTLSPRAKWRLNNGVILPPPGPWINFRLLGQSESCRVRLVEVSGRGFRRIMNSSGDEIDFWARRFSLPEETPPGPIRLTFVVQKPRYVEFVVHAEQATKTAQLRATR
jgi:hypothetical protein